MGLVHPLCNHLQVIPPVKTKPCLLPSDLPDHSFQEKCDPFMSPRSLISGNCEQVSLHKITTIKLFSCPWKMVQSAPAPMQASLGMPMLP